MNDAKSVTDLVETLQIGTPVTAGNLALIPLIQRTRAGQPLDYLLYRQAHDMGLVSITETSKDGTVGELLVANRAAQPVVLVEGEVLLGMKQTRVLNVTILAPAMTALNVPVSCVEAGRWRATSPSATGAADVNLAPSIRAAKSISVGRAMRTSRSFASDQGAVWAGVDRVLDRHGAHAPSRSFADLAAGDPSRFTGVAHTIEPAPGQVGVIACIGGRVSCADVFESPLVLAEMWDGLVASYQAEALASGDEADAPKDARRWFRSIAQNTTVVGPELGLGAHVTVVAPHVEAAALVHQGRVLHLSAFPAHNTATAPRFAPPSRRRS